MIITLINRLLGALMLLFVGASLYWHGPMVTAVYIVAFSINSVFVLFAFRALLGGGK